MTAAQGIDGGNHRSAEAIQAWLVSRLSELLGVPAERVDVTEPFTASGVSSVEAVGISGELSDWLGRNLSPTVVYNYPNIEALARHLGGEQNCTCGPLFAPREDSSSATDPIAIIGVGCRFPGAKDPQQFWKILHDGVDTIREVPKQRWEPNPAATGPEAEMRGKSGSCWGGFLEQVDQFDAQFFGIAPREAEQMDPQQRLLLEVSWEALENAGQAPEKLAGSRCGVFVGLSSSDYSRLYRDFTDLNAYTGTGNAHSVAANRLSYLLDLRGPSLAVDTACSSSLVAVHLACEGLRRAECDLALAGGVNLMLSPELTIMFSHAQMIGADGRCKTFDADADGYVRGEGCGVVVLKRYSDAVRDGNQILATVRGSAVNQDGRSNGLTAPNGPAQETVICQALLNARVAASDISYVEAHGTGTVLGDPIEFAALKAVLMRGRLPDQPCAVGSVKTNIGHLEAAAGVAGMIKVVLALQQGVIPPHLHLKKLNPQISLDGTSFLIPTRPMPWPQNGKPRLAGVSSFGFGGTNVHLILEEASLPASEPKQGGRPWHVLTLSAQSQNALSTLASQYEEYLTAHPQTSIADICFTTHVGRSHFPHRLAVAAESVPKLREQLSAYCAGRQGRDTHCGQLQSREPGKIAFLFTGQGSQYPDMGRQLYETQPAFRQVMQRCDELLRPYLEQPLLQVLYPEAGRATPLQETVYAQPALFALEYALAQLWRCWGIEPAVVLGHSVGEYVAACVAGVFSLEEAVQLVAERGRLMQALPKTGEMAAVYADEECVAAVLAGYEDRVAIAALNGPKNTVISGEREAVQAVLRRLEGEGYGARSLNTSHAFHSPLMDPVLPEFENLAQRAQFRPLQMRLISNVTGRMLKPGERMDSGYWRRQIREPVRFSDGLLALAEHGYDVFVELGPAPTLLTLAKGCVPSDFGTWLPSLRQNKEDWWVLLNSVAELCVRGVDLDWEGFHRHSQCRRRPLPTYPFERQRYWVQTSPESSDSHPSRAGSNGANGRRNPLLGAHLKLAYPPGTHVWEIELQKGDLPYLDDHRIHGLAVAPASLYIEMAQSATAEAFGEASATVIGLELKQALFLADAGSRVLQMIVSPGSGQEASFRCYSRPGGFETQESWTLHATGKISRQLSTCQLG